MSKLKNFTFNKWHWATTILAIFTLKSCGGAVDNYQELSGNYFFYGGDGDGIMSHSPDRENVYGKVKIYAFNVDFIIAKQQPDTSDYKRMISSQLRKEVKIYPKNTTTDIARTNQMADSIICSDPYYKKIFSSTINYWIISNKHKKTYGPFSEMEYLSKRKELMVPEDLKLDGENK